MAISDSPLEVVLYSQRGLDEKASRMWSSCSFSRASKAMGWSIALDESVTELNLEVVSLMAPDRPRRAVEDQELFQRNLRNEKSADQDWMSGWQNFPDGNVEGSRQDFSVTGGRERVLYRRKARATKHGGLHASDGIRPSFRLENNQSYESPAWHLHRARLVQSSFSPKIVAIPRPVR